MEEDLDVALNLDQTLGGCAVSVTTQGVDTDEGDNEGDGIIEFPFTVVYFKNPKAHTT